MSAVFKNGKYRLKPSFLEIEDNVPISDEMYAAMEKHSVVKFPYNYTHLLNRLPNNIRILHLGLVNLNIEMLANLPSSLERLILPRNVYGKNLEMLPYGIKLLYFDYVKFDYDTPTSDADFINMLPTLPPSVKLLIGGYPGCFIKIVNGEYDREIQCIYKDNGDEWSIGCDTLYSEDSFLNKYL